jgi:hypothetical protein
MKKPALVLLPFLLLFLVLPAPSYALVELGAGFTITSFEDDLDDVETDSGTALELTLGSGSARLMFALQSSSHDQGDYDALMGGVSFNLDLESFDPRIYVLIGNHEFESIDGWGLTLGGGVSWPLSTAASFGLDMRISQWEGDSYDVRTGTLQVLLRVGF